MPPGKETKSNSNEDDQGIASQSNSKKCDFLNFSVVISPSFLVIDIMLRPVQTLATTRNIVGPNNVVSCCAMLADVCKRSQQVTTCWVFR